MALIPHGPLFIDRALPERRDAATRLGLSPAPTVLFLGLIRPYKGLDVLADAWPGVRAADADARLLIVGKVFDPTVRPELDRARKLPGVDVVDHYVSVAEMLDYYAVADVVVFPYHRISQSGSFMTAVGLGRPTVITPIEGLLEQARTLTSCTVADEVSATAVARALTTSLARAADLQLAAGRDRDAIGESAVGWAAIAAATLAVYGSRGSTRSAP